MGEARNMEYFSRKAEDNEWSEPKREAMWPAARKSIMMWLATCFGTHILPPFALDDRYEATGFSVCYGLYLDAPPTKASCSPR